MGRAAGASEAVKRAVAPTGPNATEACSEKWGQSSHHTSLGLRRRHMRPMPAPQPCEAEDSCHRRSQTSHNYRTKDRIGRHNGFLDKQGLAGVEDMEPALPESTSPDPTSQEPALPKPTVQDPALPECALPETIENTVLPESADTILNQDREKSEPKKKALIHLTKGQRPYDVSECLPGKVPKTAVPQSLNPAPSPRRELAILLRPTHQI